MIYTGEHKDKKMITWTINEICNFNCSYCTQWHNKKEGIKPIDISKLSESLHYLDKDWLFLITGGEPFLEKNFIKICEEITKRHYISLNTNLSTTNVFDFADKINPEKSLFINAAVHIREREKRDVNLTSYIQKILYLQNNGFNIISYYVAHPDLFGRMEDDIAYLRSRGVRKVRIKIFRGFYKEKYYPFSFSFSEKRYLESMEADYPEFEILNKSNSHYGHLCQSGQKFLTMDRNGDLRRCSSLFKSYGNLFNKKLRLDILAKPCPTINCGCPYEGIRNALEIKGDFVSTFKEDVNETSLKFRRVIHNPKLLRKIKEKTLINFAQWQIRS